MELKNKEMIVVKNAMMTASGIMMRLWSEVNIWQFCSYIMISLRT